MSTPAQRFASLIRTATDEDLDRQLDLLCALVAEAIEPTATADVTLAALDDLASRCPSDFAGIMDTLFGSGMFTGDLDDYHDPRNSLLHEVLSRHTGMPITLSVVAMEVGKRVGVPIAGVGMPGHFVVREIATETYADPFAGGVRYDRDGIIGAWKLRMGQDAAFRPSMLRATPVRDVVLRILNNLKHSLVSRDQRVLLARLVPLRAAFAELSSETDEHRDWMRHFN